MYFYEYFLINDTHRERLVFHPFQYRNGWLATSIFLICLHIVTKNSSLETCARLWFMLLQDFFASARLHRVHKVLPKSVVHYLCHLKSNNIIGQRKTTNKEKYMIDFV